MTNTAHPLDSRPTRRARIGVGLGTAIGIAGLAVAGLAALPAQAAPTSGGEHPLDARTATLFLENLAPSGTVVGGYTGQQSEDQIYSSFKIDRGLGPVEIQLNVQANMFTPAEAKDFYRCDRDTYRSCEVKTDVDGSYLLRATRDLGNGGRGVEVDLYRGDGTRVVVETGNTADVKYGGRPHGAGITVKAATSIVQSDQWALDNLTTAQERAQARRVIRPWTLLPS